METKTFSVPALASLTTGRLLCGFSEMHELAEHLLGHPVWTHEFASKPLWDRMKAKLLEQHPDIPTETPDDVETNWQAYRDRLIDELGESREIVKGSDERGKGPIETLRELRSDAEVIVVSVQPSEN